MELLILGLLVLLLTAVALLIVLFMRKDASPHQEQQSQMMLMLQQQMDSLRGELNLSLKNTTDAVNQHLGIVTNQLHSVTNQLQNNTGQVGQRLDTAAKVIQEVQGKLGELGRATQEIKELGQSVSKLEEMLRAPKLRGGLGELLLEDLLKQVLPKGAYEVQYAFKSGHVVDALIRTAGGTVPVDSKFPLENFRRMIDAASEQEKRTASRQFVTDVKKHIDAIAQKYILPDEGTFDFALMYIPAENIYYETIIKDDALGDEGSLFSYAASKHVVPVSPNSFYAHLLVIAQGLHGLQIERSAKEIFRHLQRLTSELRKFTDVFETLGTQLGNAKNNYDKADKQLSAFGERLKSIQTSPGSEGPHELDTEGTS